MTSNNSHPSRTPPDPSVDLSLTDLLNAASSGNPTARSSVYERSYAELRSLAVQYMRSVPMTDTLQPTALVNEAYVRIASREDLNPQNSREFFGILSRAMRDILVDQARKHGAKKRGEGWTRVSISNVEDDLPSIELDVSPIVLSEVLKKLGETEPDLEEIVRLRFFAGLGLRSVSQICGVSLAHVRQDWEFARAWLRRELADHIVGADSQSHE